MNIQKSVTNILTFILIALASLVCFSSIVAMNTGSYILLFFFCIHSILTINVLSIVCKVDRDKVYSKINNLKIYEGFIAFIGLFLILLGIIYISIISFRFISLLFTVKSPFIINALRYFNIPLILFNLSALFFCSLINIKFLNLYKQISNILLSKNESFMTYAQNRVNNIQDPVEKEYAKNNLNDLRNKKIIAL